MTGKSWSAGSARETYLRKIGDGQFEYGFVQRFKNFRKRPNKYCPAGVEGSVAAAEAKRSALETGS
ncbi:hypothetical protein ACRQ5Q_16840 [Bradyrhizobium sp. PMVTL-01]|uniref:hypothetical protein n=1 Tax=Bradyrhizobium sp. PMVTL-01 TaxID=3434999 RepID=UPI003F712CC9